MLPVCLWKALVFKQPAHRNHCYNWFPKENAYVPEVLLLHISPKKAMEYLGWFMQVLYFWGAQ